MHKGSPLYRMNLLSTSLLVQAVFHFAVFPSKPFASGIFANGFFCLPVLTMAQQQFFKLPSGSASEFFAVPFNLNIV